MAKHQDVSRTTDIHISDCWRVDSTLPISDYADQNQGRKRTLEAINTEQSL